jgi:hypothetical protein
MLPEQSGTVSSSSQPVGRTAILDDSLHEKEEIAEVLLCAGCDEPRATHLAAELMDKRQRFFSVADRVNLEVLGRLFRQMGIEVQHVPPRPTYDVGSPELHDALADLPPSANALIEDGSVMIVYPDSPEVPDALKNEINRRANGTFTSRGAAVCHLRDDGQVLVVLISQHPSRTVIQHELIHAAQVWCDEETMRNAFEACGADGKRIAEACMKSGSPDGDREDVHRDVGWTRGACESAAASKDPNAWAHETFDLALMVHPTAETAVIASSYGIAHPRAVVAALHAHFMQLGGFADWKSDVAREIVAHRYEQGRHDLIDRLFNSALLARTEEHLRHVREVFVEQPVMRG